MSDFSTKLKGFLGFSATAIGKAANVTAKAIKKAASNTANATKYKMNEMTSTRQRNDLIAELGEKVYELAKGGAVLPAEAAELIAQIKHIDCELATLHTEREAYKAAAAEQHAAEKAARAAEKAASKAGAAIEKCTEPVEYVVSEPAPIAPVLEVEEAPAAEETAEPVPTLDVEPENL